MNDIWMIVIGLVSGMCISELGWTRMVICKLRRNCKGKCPSNSET